MRLNKFIAHATGISRREADELIRTGNAVVNGKAADLGCDVDPNDDTVTVNNQLVKLPTEHTTIMLNKPVGYVCSYC